MKRSSSQILQTFEVLALHIAIPKDKCLSLIRQAQTTTNKSVTAGEACNGCTSSKAEVPLQREE